jgi:hypothetical protein
MRLSLSTKVVQNPNMLHAVAGEEVMMMDVPGGSYYGLDAIGARIWGLIAQPATLDSVCAQLTSEYDVPEDICHVEVLTFVEELVDRRAVDVVYE